MSPVTHIDLANLKSDIKSEIYKEQTELRHEDRNKMQKYFLLVDDLKTDNALSNQFQKNMSETVKEIKEIVTQWFKDINEKINEFPKNFATKEDHKENSVKISELEKWVSGINLKIAMVSGGFWVVIFIIEKLWK